MSVSEILTVVLSLTSMFGGILVVISNWLRSSQERAAKKAAAEYFGHAAITKAILASSKNDKFTKEQLEIVSRIVWRNSVVPLTTILKSPEERYNIYKGLSDPNQYPWDTEESSFIKD